MKNGNRSHWHLLHLFEVFCLTRRAAFLGPSVCDMVNLATEVEQIFSFDLFLHFWSQFVDLFLSEIVETSCSVSCHRIQTLEGRISQQAAWRLQCAHASGVGLVP